MLTSRKSVALAVAILYSLSTAHAQEKVWKHGILEAKSDAGFIAMVDKGGFAAKRGLKLEILQIKAGATLLQLYTGLVFRGIGLLSEIKADLSAALRRGHRDSLAAMVGADAAEITAESWPS